MATPSKKPTILETIYAQRAKDVELAKSTPGTTPDDLNDLLAMHLAPSLISFVDRLKRNPSTSASSVSLMAEIKRASPSKGPISLTANAPAQALTYALAGASVISVLTEPTWFKGSLLDLRLARQAINALPDRPAVLRKEFILDEYQIAEARLHGADTVLLIVAMLSPERLKALYTYSLGLGMEPLVEVNNAPEMKIALDLGSKVIGVNNRNLHDFNVDMGTTSRLVEMVRERDVILCALSGISSPKDVQVYKDEGVRAVLVGEALMRAQDTSAFIRDLLQWPEPVHAKKTEEKVWVKVNGVTSKEQAAALADAGADMLGLFIGGTSNNTTSITIQSAIEISNTIRSSSSSSFSSAVATISTPTSPQPWFTAQKQHLTSLASTTTRPLLVGIFPNATAASLGSILQTTRLAQLDFVQLDASAPAALVDHIPVPVIRAFSLGATENVGDISRPGVHKFVVLNVDHAHIGKAKEIVNKGEVPGWPMPIILGLDGKLTKESAVETAKNVGAWGLDVDAVADVVELVKTVKSA
jgi:anthranilate synthase / indole-3-glycerol phosphate synthase / phosphoribosylanthranilate isomerase